MKTKTRVIPLRYLLGPAVVLLLLSGCNANPGVPPVPVFTWDVPLPANEDTSAAELTLPAGGQTVLPVTLKSTRNQDMAVSLKMDFETGFPDDIQVTFSTPQQDIPLPSGGQHISKITFTASRDVPPGVYRSHLVGTLREPVDGEGGIACQIDIHVTAN